MEEKNNPTKTTLGSVSSTKKIFHNLEEINLPSSDFNAYCYNQKTILFSDTYDISQWKYGPSLAFLLVHKSDCCVLQHSSQNISLHFGSTLPEGPFSAPGTCSWTERGARNSLAQGAQRLHFEGCLAFQPIFPTRISHPPMALICSEH